MPDSEQIQRIRLVSNNFGHGPIPGEDTVVEQRITLRRDGRVWFSSYTYHKRMEFSQFRVDPVQAADVIDCLSASTILSEVGFDALDTGEWSLELVTASGMCSHFAGTLVPDQNDFLTNVSKDIRILLHRDDLFAFDDLGLSLPPEPERKESNV